MFSCGTTTVVTLSAVYAQEVMQFTPADLITLILVVNVTAAVGAMAFGYLQDRIGSIKTLVITLLIWTVAMIIAVFATTREVFWVVGNLVGIAMGSSQATARALVGLLSPEGRSGEFFGLWGLVIKLATAVGPFTFGMVVFATGSNYRIALTSTIMFFLASLFLVLRVDEERGRRAAAEASAEESAAKPAN